MADGSALSTLRSLPDVVAEYEAKKAAIPAALAAFRAAGDTLKMAASVGGAYGQENIDVGYMNEHTLQKNLLRSAWIHVWDGLNMKVIASAKDKDKWERAMGDPAPFTLENLRATFAPYLVNPRHTILRGLAEVFADLDPAYKSHEKVKIGVKGLPKRVIIHGLNNTFGRGWDAVDNIINALAVYQGKPMLSAPDRAALREDGDALREDREMLDPYDSVHVHRRRAERGEPAKTIKTTGRGIWLKTYANGNGHLYFDDTALRDINMALAEYYGDVLADSPEADAERLRPRHETTAVSKDLQFYPTPEKVIAELLSGYDTPDWAGLRVLEPSCGDGRIMDALRKKGAGYVFGIEVDGRRAQEARDKGHHVMTANFLTTYPSDGLAGQHWRDFDAAVMNPPFAGKHYAKHVRNALQWVKPGGVVIAILPATARYDHGLLDDLSPQWRDLPVGAFAESGTNVCTTICKIRKPLN